ncbi:tetratricopeptide repeat protein [Sulfurimonas sp.]|uniref:tetratricopeptide repeat protein n=1 Tax=Sulfurimonas sp. TaxID=2022749 RepID=UPI002B46118D|nr:tetratricopeptide repeat protein [Sulfurimonas sp.]
MFKIIKVIIVFISLVSNLYSSYDIKLTNKGIESLSGILISDNIKLDEAMTYNYSIQNLEGVGLSILYEYYGQSKKQCYIPIYKKNSIYFLDVATCFEITIKTDKQGNIRPNWLGYRVKSKKTLLKSANIDSIINSENLIEKSIGYFKNDSFIFDNLMLVSNKGMILSSSHVFMKPIMSNGFAFIDLSMIEAKPSDLTPKEIENKLKSKNSSFYTKKVINDTLLKYELSKKNLIAYNNIAYYLEKAKAYPEAIYLLEKILKKYPNRTVAYINLGDAYWGLKNKEKAKQAYSTYIKQMKEKGKDRKIPKVVLERIK